MKLQTTRELTLCAFFTALIVICAQIQIPLPMIPINLALFAVHLAGIVLGVRYGVFSVFLYILLGLIGIPVFANFGGGIGVLFGKTGGYVIGYLLDVLIVALLSRKRKDSFFCLCFAMLIGTVLCYLFGSIWFMFLTKMNLTATLIYCVLPFLPGDVIKIFLAALVMVKLSKRIKINIS